MIEVIAEHSVDTSLLGKGSFILDLGCRGFEFTDYFRKLGHCVIAVDIALLPRTDYVRCAVGGSNKRVGIKYTNDPQATSIIPGDDINCWDIKTISRFSAVKRWAVIKMDIEGSELETILSWDEPPAKQLSIEFHLHTGVYDETDVKIMVGVLNNLGYKTVKHDKYKAHGCGENYWDSLFILK